MMKYLSFLIILCTLFTFSCSENSSTTPQSSAKEIISFLIESHSLSGKIDNTGNSIVIKSTPGINLTNLTPTIEISVGASINPPSGVPQDFSTPLNYTVTAADGSSTDYQVSTDVGNYILNCNLLIVHMQNYFITQNRIHNSEGVISTIQGILQSAREENIPVVYSKSQPARNREIIDALAPRSSETVIESSTDAPVVDAIDLLGVSNVIVVGIFTHQCIRDICTRLNSEGYNVFLVNDATSVSMTDDINLIETTCNELEQNGIVQLLSSDELTF